MTNLKFIFFMMFCHLKSYNNYINLLISFFIKLMKVLVFFVHEKIPLGIQSHFDLNCESLSYYTLT